MILEICAESYEAAVLAKKYKVKRTELCSALGVGGLTPSIGLVKKCAELEGAEVHAMIRHKEGSFIYSKDDITIMQNDIMAVKAAGGHGVVFGCLNKKDQLDVRKNAILLETAKSLELETTFHRAFDFIEDSEKALKKLIAMGFDRILTSGKAKKAIDGFKVLTSIAEYADDRIQIMAGSGVNHTNSIKLSKTGVDALHFTIHKKAKAKDLGMGAESEMDTKKLMKIVKLFKGK